MTKNDYISREAAIEKIRVVAGCAECDGNSSVLCDCGFCDVYNAIRLIKSLPAADVEPVRHGGWIIAEDEYSSYAKCSVCGDEFTFWEGDCAITQYCPSCGAKMDLEGENDENFGR